MCESEMFQWLWDYLIPPGEKPRQLKARQFVFPEYLPLENPLKDKDIVQAGKIAILLRAGRDKGDFTNCAREPETAVPLKRPSPV